MQPPENTPTYVLVGYDPHNAFRDNKEAFRRAGAIIIQQQPGQLFEDTVKQIQGPANIILAAHGDPFGEFTWRLGERMSYAQLFAELPQQDIASIGLLSCYGGTVWRSQPPTPAGALIYTMVSPINSSIIGDSSSLGQETAGVTDPVNLYLETLDSFQPAYYRKTMECINALIGAAHNPRDDQALPNIIGIGGQTPQLIYLDQEVKRLTHRQDDAWAHAIVRVKQHFDVSYSKSGSYLQKDCIPQLHTGTEDEKRQLDARIDTVARKIERGETPKDTEERRIAYGLTAAYMDESGELARMQDAARWQGSHSVGDDTLYSLIKPAPMQALEYITQGNFSAAVNSILAAKPLAALDGADGSPPNHRISLTELKVALEKRGITSLDEVDTDHDHNVTAAEIAAALRKDDARRTR